MTRKLRSPWLVLLVLIAMVATLAACGEDEEAQQQQAQQGQGDQKRQLTIGLVTDIGGLNDRGFNALSADGLKRAERELGVKTRILESKSDADYVPNLSTLAEEKVDLSISVGFLMGDATRKAAQEFPDQKFAIIDFAYDEKQALPNLQGLVFKEQETGYLAGYMAGLVTEEKGERTNTASIVSSVGGQKIPPVDKFIAGYQKGAKDANPGVRTLNGYSQDFVDQAKCKEVALDQIAKGSDVVFQVAGGCGLGALDAAKEQNVWGIGVDKDQAVVGDQVLTSALKRVDVAVFDFVKSVVDGKFQGGGVTVFGLAENGVGLGKVSPDVDKAIVDRVKAQEAKVKAGDVDIPEEVK